jgi:hypothetical protein
MFTIFIASCQVLKLNDTITWLGGEIPQDEPRCGFDNKGCDNEIGKQV